MEFAKSDALTFGLELEFQIINQATGLLSPSSLEIWKNLAFGRAHSRNRSNHGTGYSGRRNPNGAVLE